MIHLLLLSLVMQHAPMEISDWLVALLTLKVVSKSATMQCGEQYVTICGVPLMLTLLADNWDTLQQVILTVLRLKHSNYDNSVYRSHCILLCPVWPGHRPHPTRQCGLPWKRE